MAEQEFGEAYIAVRYVYDNSPRKSWSRLNGALHLTLAAAIEAHLSFLSGDFQAMRSRMAGHYWMGNSQGSTCGERYYTLAVKMGHGPACIAFEQYAERPAALWADDVKAPARLCIGSRFTWKGVELHVSNIKDGGLLACAYGDSPEDKLEKGCIRYFENAYRRIEALKVLGSGGYSVRFSAEKADYDRRPKKIVKITYEELAAARKSADVERKRALKEIATVTTDAELSPILDRLNAGWKLFRKFDQADFREAISAKRKELSGAEQCS